MKELKILATAYKLANKYDAVPFLMDESLESISNYTGLSEDTINMCIPRYSGHNRGDIINMIIYRINNHDSSNEIQSCSEVMDDILLEIKKEREKQNEKWGEQNHLPIEWIAILSEEVGEASKEALDEHFKNPPKDIVYQQLSDKALSNIRHLRYRNELIQVAAVAVQMIESLYRNQDPYNDKIKGLANIE